MPSIYIIIRNRYTELRKSGFTIIELIISLTVMLTVMAATFPIVFNKVQKPSIVRNDASLACGCKGCFLDLLKDTGIDSKKNKKYNLECEENNKYYMVK